VISEGSCDSVMHHRNKLEFKIYQNRKLFYLLFNCIFNQINAALVNMRVVFLTVVLLKITTGLLVSASILILVHPCLEIEMVQEPI